MSVDIEKYKFNRKDLHRLKALVDRSNKGLFPEGAHNLIGSLADEDSAKITRYLREPSANEWNLVKGITILPDISLQELMVSGDYPAADDLAAAVLNEIKHYKSDIYKAFAIMIKEVRRGDNLPLELAGN
jgi:hypothetical protein